MQFFRKIFTYFIYNPLEILILNTAIRTKGNLFVLIFNLLSFIKKSENRIIFKKNFFFIKEINWRFFQKKQGIHVYSRGMIQRIKELQNFYHLNEINFNDDDIIIDVGANNGDFYLCFKKKIKYFGFEASPSVFSNLEYNIKNQNLLNFALSYKKNEQVDFYINDDFGDSSVLPLKNFHKIIKVNTTTLDNEIFKIQKKIKLIKIEAEGYEPEILLGLLNYINDVEYITIDCGYERGIHNECTIEKCSNYLIKNGFEMIKFNNTRISALFKNTNFVSLPKIK